MFNRQGFNQTGEIPIVLSLQASSSSSASPLRVGTSSGTYNGTGTEGLTVNVVRVTSASIGSSALSQTSTMVIYVVDSKLSASGTLLALPTHVATSSLNLSSMSPQQAAATLVHTTSSALSSMLSGSQVPNPARITGSNASLTTSIASTAGAVRSTGSTQNASSTQSQSNLLILGGKSNQYSTGDITSTPSARLSGVVTLASTSSVVLTVTDDKYDNASLSASSVITGSPNIVRTSASTATSLSDIYADGFSAPGGGAKLIASGDIYASEVVARTSSNQCSIYSGIATVAAVNSVGKSVLSGVSSEVATSTISKYTNTTLQASASMSVGCLVIPGGAALLGSLASVAVTPTVARDTNANLLGDGSSSLITTVVKTTGSILDVTALSQQSSIRARWDDGTLIAYANMSALAGTVRTSAGALDAYGDEQQTVTKAINVSIALSAVSTVGLLTTVIKPSGSVQQATSDYAISYARVRDTGNSSSSVLTSLASAVAVYSPPVNMLADGEEHNSWLRIRGLDAVLTASSGVTAVPTRVRDNDGKQAATASLLTSYVAVRTSSTQQYGTSTLSAKANYAAGASATPGSISYTSATSVVKWSGASSLAASATSHIVGNRNAGAKSQLVASAGITPKPSAVRFGNNKSVFETLLRTYPNNTFSEAYDVPFRQIIPKIDIYFDGDAAAPIEFGMEDLVDMTILEELKAENLSPIGYVSANELTLSMWNNNDRFTPTNTSSPYYGKMKPGVKVVASLGVYLSDVDVRYTQVGIFRTTDWSAQSGSIECAITAYDRLYTLKQKDVPSMRLIRNTTVKDLLGLVFNYLGLSPSDYSIDNALAIPIPMAWLPAGKAGDVLQLIAEAGKCFIYDDRNDIITVKPMILNDTSVKSINDHTQVINLNNSITFQPAYSTLNLYQYAPTVGDFEEVGRIRNVTAAVGTTTLNAQQFNTSPVAAVYRVEAVGAETTTVTDCNATVWDIDIELTNTGTAADPLDIVIQGNAIKQSKTKVQCKDVDLYNVIGEKLLEIDNHLIQDPTYASSYANDIFALVSRIDPVISVDTRGNPTITPGMTITVTDEATKTYNQKMLIYRHQLKYDGGLSAVLDGYKIS